MNGAEPYRWIGGQEWALEVQRSRADRPYVAGLDGYVYPEALARDLGVDGYGCATERAAIVICRWLRQGRPDKAEDVWLRHLMRVHQHSGRRQSLTNHEVATVIELARAGWDVRRIANRLRATMGLVRRILEAAEVGTGEDLCR